MLVLTRKAGESIQIGEDIEIKVVAVNGDQIKLGIEAPQNIEIHRTEIYKQIIQENQVASQLTKDTINLLKNAKKD
ncbi:carbon storage regulator CsrA [Piscibacillus halophilus]|uniref:Translational regulator CsrA n=1 Tax=Piscibacillus halophilus TaxID=571933 RepID=A0A1H9EHG7_9BACI|nr:carbon storage regulator CsrA [Piscibacillus halophilus]SEQ25180.1 carbon storage regulator, CsrA [Piscibacillus halophilus]